MSDPHQERGGPPPDALASSLSSSPDQISLSYAKAAGGAPGGTSHLQKYAEIIAKQKSQRNVLEVKIKKVTPENTKSLNFDDISELVFETLNVQFEDCIGVDYFTGRYDTREIILKPGVDSSRYITTVPILYKEHHITVKKMLNDANKVTCPR